MFLSLQRPNANFDGNIKDTIRFTRKYIYKHISFIYQKGPEIGMYKGFEAKVDGASGSTLLMAGRVENSFNLLPLSVFIIGSLFVHVGDKSLPVRRRKAK